MGKIHVSVIMVESSKMQDVARFILSKRPTWQMQSEEEILKINTRMITIEWRIIQDIGEKFKIHVRDVSSINNQLFITFTIPEGA